MKPWVIANVIMSVDGKIGKFGKRKVKLFDKLDQERTKNLLSQVDALLIGIETIKEKEEEYQRRSYEVILESEETEEEEEKNEGKVIIVDSKAELSPSFELVSEILKDKKVIVAVSSKVERRKIKHLKEKEGVEVMMLGKYTVNLRELLDRLYRRGIRKILLEDQRALMRRMFQEDLVDELYVLIVPILIGEEGISLIEKLGGEEKKLSLEGIIQYGDRVLLHYFFDKSAAKFRSEKTIAE
jgi:2,5-diamino-6-(ribosylamino)-4(3H)-pyrimidinone 5'-phosphate reductase